MSTDIQPGKLPINIASNSSPKSAKSPLQDTNNAGHHAVSAKSADTVSMTDRVSRLQEIESMLADIPPVNDSLVEEIGLAMSNGSLDIDLQRIASKLVEFETGVPSRK